MCLASFFFFDAISISRNTPIGHLKYLSDVNNFTHYYGFSVFINMNIDFSVQIRSLYQNRDPSWKYNRSWNCYFYIKLTLKLVNRWFWHFWGFFHCMYLRRSVSAKLKIQYRCPCSSNSTQTHPYNLTKLSGSLNGSSRRLCPELLLELFIWYFASRRFRVRDFEWMTRSESCSAMETCDVLFQI